MSQENYDTDNIFAKILRGELPTHKVYEDSETLAFMDIMPRSPGHCLVIPKRAARNILDADLGAVTAVMETVQKIARACMSAFGADGVIIQQFNEPASGQVVFHLHVHVIPCFQGVALRPHTSEMADENELKKNAEKLRQALDAAA